MGVPCFSGTPPPPKWVVVLLFCEETTPKKNRPPKRGYLKNMSFCHGLVGFKGKAKLVSDARFCPTVFLREFLEFTRRNMLFCCCCCGSSHIASWAGRRRAAEKRAMFTVRRKQGGNEETQGEGVQARALCHQLDGL